MPTSLHGLSASEIAARLDALEAKLAFAEDAQNQLHEALVSQQRRIDELEVGLRFVLETVRNLDPVKPPVDTAEERPPHY